MINVGEVIGQVRAMLDQMSVAISLAGSVTILAGIAVLVGAIAASRQARSYDSVILKTLGATRAHILAAQGLEYALLAAVLVTLMPRKPSDAGNANRVRRLGITDATQCATIQGACRATCDVRHTRSH